MKMYRSGCFSNFGFAQITFLHSVGDRPGTTGMLSLLAIFLSAGAPRRASFGWITLALRLSGSSSDDDDDKEANSSTSDASDASDAEVFEKSGKRSSGLSSRR